MHRYLLRYISVSLYMYVHSNVVGFRVGVIVDGSRASQVRLRGFLPPPNWFGRRATDPVRRFFVKCIPQTTLAIPNTRP